MKRMLSLLAISVFLLGILAFPVSANAPPDAEIPAIVTIGAILLLLLTIAVRIAVTCWSEWFLAPFLGIDKTYGKLIVKTNLVSQGLMWLLVLVGFFFFPSITMAASIEYYTFCVAILEMPIFVGEFLFYRKKFVEISWGICLLYTVVANTVSLLLGLLLNWFM